MPPTDYQGRPYGPGQKIVRPFLMGCSPYLEQRTVLAVVDGDVIIEPAGGESKPRVLKRPERACIL